ncbi:SIS domain-containing protein [Thalassotalea euphylliae]|uniref:SIS domain-containing protein n=1 Tax=Thalassotalea euphylliae TaxID=1655234 RepID=A0A3E0TNB0_9GAMM|nr:SIS domain-containing protein [Thalassotalea euphylliae]REL26059.1 SIS domain-containing protein [Thalassotalea euphylliae]
MKGSLDNAVKHSSTELLVTRYTKNLTKVLTQLNHQDVDLMVAMLLNLKSNNRTLFICGNGGSAANAIHLANDYTFGVNPQGNALNVEALAANSSVLTCLGNDIGYENIFSHQLKVKGQTGDILLVLSGSGNSENIIKAIEEAKQKEMQTIAILGFDGGKAKNLVDLAFHFNIDDMQISEDTQVILGHIIMQSLRDAVALHSADEHK